MGDGEVGRADFLKPEVVRPLGVESIEPINPAVEFLPIKKDKNGHSDLSVFLVGANRGATDRLKRAGFYGDLQSLLPFKSSGTSGRTVMFEMEWVSPGIKTEDGITTIDHEERIHWTGVDIKGGGATLEGFQNQPHGWHRTSKLSTSVRIGTSGIMGNKDALDLGPRGQDLVGSCDWHHCLGEYEDTLAMITAGARVPMPLFVAKLSKNDVGYGKRVAGGLELGVIARAYRSPLTWADLLVIKPSEPEKALDMMNRALKYLVVEGLLNKKETEEIRDEDPVLKSQKLARLYLISGAKIMGENLARIHIIRSIGNRNLQNTSMVFEHRDLWDGADLNKSWNKLNEPRAKFEDVITELINFRRLTEVLIPDRFEEVAREISVEYLVSYLRSERGLSKRQFGLMFLNTVLLSLPEAGLNSLTAFDLEPFRELGRMGEVYREAIHRLIKQ